MYVYYCRFNMTISYKKGLQKSQNIRKKNMKKTTILILITIISLLGFSSCASKRGLYQKERSETFIADLDSFYLGDVGLYSSLALNDAKVSTYELDFYPRTNSISMQGKISIDAIGVVFPYAERVKIYKAAQEYLTAYEAGTLKDEKPTKKNAFFTSEISIQWGVLGLSHSITVKYAANVEYLAPDKPYFRLKFDATDDYTDNSTSPAFCIYVSPSQWSQLFELCDQETLEARCDEIIEQAEAF